jgi:tRNA(adenine34) deaminase
MIFRKLVLYVVPTLVLFVTLSTLIVDCWTPLSKIRQRTLDLPKSQNVTKIHNHFMGLALQQARVAETKGEVPIGAVIVERKEDGDFSILAQACNLVETTHDASAHAELLALRQAAKRVKNWRLANTTLYTSLEPCPMCLAAAQAFRVSSIVYGAPDLRLGAIETHIRLLDVEHPFHAIDEVIPGVLGNESAFLLRDFFRKRRKKPSRLPQSVSLRARIKKLFLQSE